MTSIGQIHTQSALFLVNVPPLLFEYEGVWGPISGTTFGKEKNFLPFSGIRLRFLFLSPHTLVTVTTEQILLR
jgi:hypothetical protein